jgi:hypothetical protein
MMPSLITPSQVLHKIKGGKPGLYRMIMTNDAAKMLWALNTDNIRNLKKTNVEMLRYMLRNGEYQSDHPEALLFNTEGVLMNGQHRIYAFLDADLNGKPLVVRIATGVPPDVKGYLDNGMPRMLSERVGLSEKNNKVISQIITCAINLDRAGTRRITPLEAQTYYDAHNTALEWVATVKKKRPGIGSNAVAVAAMEYYERSRPMAKEFYNDLFDFEGYVHQAQKLRQLLMVMAFRKQTSGAANRVIQYRKAIYCMKKHLSGEEIHRVYGQDWD